MKELLSVTQDKSAAHMSSILAHSSTSGISRRHRTLAALGRRCPLKILARERSMRGGMHTNNLATKP